MTTLFLYIISDKWYKGQNPYQDWATLSLGNDWQYHMSLAANDKNSVSSDINHVKTSVEQANGDNGVRGYMAV